MSIQRMGQSLTRLLLEYEAPLGVLKVEKLQTTEGKMNGRLSQNVNYSHVSAYSHAIPQKQQ